MKTPEDGDKVSTGLGQKVPPKPPPPKKERHWKLIPGRPGYMRHEITGDVQRVFV